MFFTTEFFHFVVSKGDTELWNRNAGVFSQSPGPGSEVNFG